jgi:hypothetical protein
VLIVVKSSEYAKLPTVQNLEAYGSRGVAIYWTFNFTEDKTRIIFHLVEFLGKGRNLRTILLILSMQS